MMPQSDTSINQTLEPSDAKEMWVALKRWERLSPTLTTMTTARLKDLRTRLADCLKLVDKLLGTTRLDSQTGSDGGDITSGPTTFQEPLSPTGKPTGKPTSSQTSKSMKTETSLHERGPC